MLTILGLSTIGSFGLSAAFLVKSYVTEKKISAKTSGPGKYIYEYKLISPEYLKIINAGEVVPKKETMWYFKASLVPIAIPIPQSIEAEDRVVIKDIVMDDFECFNFTDAKNYTDIIPDKCYCTYDELSNYKNFTRRVYFSKYRFSYPMCFISETYVRRLVYLYGEYKDNIFMVDSYSNNRDKLLLEISDNAGIHYCFIAGVICAIITAAYHYYY